MLERAGRVSLYAWPAIRDGYRGKPWTIRQFAGFGTPEETNARYQQLLAPGEPVSASPSICRR